MNLEGKKLFESVLHQIKNEIRNALIDAQIAIKQGTTETRLIEGEIIGLEKAENILKRSIRNILQQSYTLDLDKTCFTEEGKERLFRNLSKEHHKKEYFERVILFLAGEHIYLKFPDKKETLICIPIAEGQLKVIMVESNDVNGK